MDDLQMLIHDAAPPPPPFDPHTILSRPTGSRPVRWALVSVPLVLFALALAGGLDAWRAGPLHEPAASNGTAKGRVAVLTADQTTRCHPGGDLTGMPEWTPVATRDRGGVTEAVIQTGALCGASDTPVPAYARDLKTLVGHMYPDRGFVPTGTDPATVPCFEGRAGGFSTAPDGTTSYTSVPLACDPPYRGG